jgi:hypothetical protein
LNNSDAALRHSGTEEMTDAGEMSEVQEEGSEEVEAGEKRGGDGRPEELRREEGEAAQERVGSEAGQMRWRLAAAAAAAAVLCRAAVRCRCCEALAIAR